MLFLFGHGAIVRRHIAYSSKGETLYSIARQYHVSVEALEKTNKSSLGEDNKLKIGQKIIIPASAAQLLPPKPLRLLWLR